jgi:hypothetical protein
MHIYGFQIQNTAFLSLYIPYIQFFASLVVPVQREKTCVTILFKNLRNIKIREKFASDIQLLTELSQAMRSEVPHVHIFQSFICIFRCFVMVKAVLRIRDVHPGSRILIFIHPGSRIPGSTTAPKEEGKFFNFFLS